MDKESGTGLPAVVEAAWGLRERSHKGPKRGLSLDRIVEAAGRIANAEGLRAVSMNRVAGEVGASTMALYRYVTSKEELVELMRDAAFGPAPAPRPGEDWRPALSRWGWALRDAYTQNPWVLQVPIRGIPIMPNELSWFEAGLAALGDTRLAENEKASAVLLISGYVRNEAMLTGEIGAAFEAAGSTPSQVLADASRMIAKLTDPLKFPALHALLAAGVFNQADPPEVEFTFGLERVLDGIEVLVRTRADNASRGDA